MKKAAKLLSGLLIPVLMMLCLVSCIDGDTAKGTIEEFLGAVSKEDYEYAKTLLHPERPADLMYYFESIEDAEQIDFAEGVMLVRYTGVHISAYDSSVDGSAYRTTVKVTIGDVPATLDIEIVENDAGYGIYNLNIDIEK